MKVKELIKKLQKFNGELLVLGRGYEDGYDDIVTIKKRNLFKDDNGDWYNGTYQTFEKGEKLIKAITITRSN